MAMQQFSLNPDRSNSTYQRQISNRRQNGVRVDIDDTSVTQLNTIIGNEFVNKFGQTKGFLTNQDTSSQKYLEHIQQSIPLSDLYKIVECYHEDERLPNCAILVEDVRAQVLSSQPKYLLQIWNSQGQQIYERPLKQPPIICFMSSKVFVFKPDKDDQVEGEESYVLIYLQKNCAEIRINLQNKPFWEIQENTKFAIAFANQQLYLSTGKVGNSPTNTIHIITIQYPNQKVRDDNILYGIPYVISEISDKQLYVIDIGNTIIHKFMFSQRGEDVEFLTMCTETQDNQIDFYYLLYPQQNKNGVQHSIKQAQEVNQRNPKVENPAEDPVEKFKSVNLQNGFNFSVALRFKGKLDFYWNYIRINNDYDKYPEVYKEIEVNFEGIYLKDKDMNVKRISLTQEGNIGLTVAKNMVQSTWREGESFDTINLQKIKDKVKLFGSTCLIRTTFMVASNTKVFFYDMNKKKDKQDKQDKQDKLGDWADENINFNKRIVTLFRNEPQPGLYRVGVLFEDGKVSFLENYDTYSYETSKWYVNSLSDINLGGKIINECQELIQGQSLRTLVLNNSNKAELVTYTNSKEVLLKEGGFEEKTKVMPYFAVGKSQTQTDTLSQVMICEQTFTNLPRDTNVEEEKNPEQQEGQQLQQIKRQQVLRFYLVTQDLSQKQPLTYTEKFTIKESDFPPISTQEIGKKENKFQKTIFDEKLHHSIEFGSNTCFIIGEQNIYKVTYKDNQQTVNVSVFPNANIKALQIIDKSYCYAIVAYNDGYPQDDGPISGLKFFTIGMLSALKEGGSLDSLYIHIDGTIAGANSYIDFGQDNQRIAYMKNFTIAKILPVVHRSTVNFLGMLPRKCYLACKKVGEEFLALDHKGFITVWDVLSGQIKQRNQVTDIYTTTRVANQEIERKVSMTEARISFQDFEIFGSKQNEKSYMREWHQPRSLIYKSSTLLDVTSDLPFIKNRNIITQIENSQAYILNESLKYTTFMLIEIRDATSISQLMKFEHQYLYKGYQRIFIASNRKLMIEVLSNHRAMLYEQGYDEENQKTFWNYIRKFHEFPHEFCEMSPHLFMFTPNLERYIYFDKSVNEFQIRNTLSTVKQMDLIVTKIPKYLMNDNSESSLDIIKRFKWVDFNKFIICNDWGLEQLIQIEGLEENFNIDPEELEEQKQRQYRFIELSFNRMPKFSEFKKQSVIKYQQHHLYDKPVSLGYDDIIRRLQAKYRQVKHNRYLLSPMSIYNFSKANEDIASIDYNIDNSNGPYVADISFSYICWKIVEAIEKGKWNAAYLDEKYAKVISLNILPGLKTVLHVLTKRSLELSAILAKVPVFVQSDGIQEEFEMPFIQDINNNSPLHYSNNQKDYISCNIMLEYLKDAPIDHHSREITSVLPSLIKQNLKGLHTYLDSRFQETKQLRRINRGEVMTYMDLSYGITTSSLNANEETLKQSLYKQKVAGTTEINEVDEGKQDPLQVAAQQSVQGKVDDGKFIIENDIQCKFLDLPQYFNLSTEQSKAFFKALNDCEDTSIFELKSIRCIIDYNWPVARGTTIRVLRNPFFVFLFLYWVYSNFVIDYYLIEAPEYLSPVELVFLVVLTLFSLKFLMNEVSQIRNSNIWEYFKSGWNFIDYTPPLIILLITTVSLIDRDKTLSSLRWNRFFISLGSLLMWLKLLYFFRYDKNTGYLIRMIAKVIQGIFVFLLVFLITILAFGDAFINLQKESQVFDYDPKEQSIFIYIYMCVQRFFESAFFTYQMVLGNVSLDGFDDPFLLAAAIFVILCTLFVMIVMLNLLISIVGQIFGVVEDNQVNEFYQEKASIISENLYLIDKDFEAKKQDKDHLLLICMKNGDEEFAPPKLDGPQENLYNYLKAYFDMKLAQEIIRMMKKEENKQAE